MDQTQLNIILALSANAFMHITIEIWSVREKVRRLSAYMNKKPYKEFPLNINTRLKSYTFSLIGFLLMTGVAYIFFCWLNLSASTAYRVIVGLFIATFLMIAIGLDKYHVEIERVTRPFKSKK